MKRLLILADMHGNLPALQAVMDAVQHEALDGIIVAGDLTGGPQPNETMRLLQQRNAWMVRGNTDENILRYVNGEAPALWHTNLQWAVMRWSLDVLENDVLSLLQSLPEQRVVNLPGCDSIRVVHGSPRSSSEGLHPDQSPELLERAVQLTPEAVLICGHTHEPWQRCIEKKLLINPGSVAASLNGDTRAHFALLRWENDRWQAELRAVDYNHSLIRAAFIESGLLEQGGALARAFLLTAETGQDVARDYFALMRRLMAEKHLTDMDTIPDEVWVKAERLFDWEKWSSV